MKTKILMSGAAGLLLCGTAWALPEGMRCPAPQWPKEALRYEIEGTTTVEYIAGKDGKVHDATVLKSSGWPLLDAASLRHVRQCSLPSDPERDDTKAQFMQEVWSLQGERRVQPQLLAGSCTGTAHFDEFSHERRVSRPSFLLRFLVNADGSPRGIAVDSKGPPELVAEAATFVASCRFAVPAGSIGAPTDTSFGRALMRTPQ